jgi:hypothetical protein
MAQRDNNQDGRQSQERNDSNSGTGKQRRGFAAMSKEQRSRIAREGGKASRGGGRPRTNR